MHSYPNRYRIQLPFSGATRHHTGVLLNTTSGEGEIFAVKMHKNGDDKALSTFCACHHLEESTPGASCDHSFDFQPIWRGFISVFKEASLSIQPSAEYSFHIQKYISFSSSFDLLTKEQPVGI